MKTKKVGLLGGTFDPPHYGHLMIANEVLEQCKLDEIWFVPAHVPPHKQIKKVSDSIHRAAMLQIAIEHHPCFRLSTIEIERQGLSYTYKTLEKLTSEYKHIDFFFIIGADMVHDLPNWKNIERILQMTTFIGVNRQGFTVESPYEDHIKLIDVPLFAISSTLLRKRFREKRSTRYYLPENVRHYIKENHLYE